MKTETTRFLRVGALIFLGVGLWVSSTAAYAACLIKARDVNALSNSPPLIMAPESEIAAYIDKGYSRAACPKDMSLIQEFVRKLCDKTQNNLKLSGVSPNSVNQRSRDQACKSAQTALTEEMSK
jgi:hypothetical protein